MDRHYSGRSQRPISEIYSTSCECVVSDAVLCAAAQRGVKSKTLSTQMTFAFMATDGATATAVIVPEREDKENFTFPP